LTCTCRQVFACKLPPHVRDFVGYTFDPEILDLSRPDPDYALFVNSPKIP
jgi:hypothetical protein